MKAFQNVKGYMIEGKNIHPFKFIELKTHMKVFQNVKIMIEGPTDWYAVYYYHRFS